MKKAAPKANPSPSPMAKVKAKAKPAIVVEKLGISNGNALIPSEQLRAWLQGELILPPGD